MARVRTSNGSGATDFVVVVVVLANFFPVSVISFADYNNNNNWYTFIFR